MADLFGLSADDVKFLKDLRVKFQNLPGDIWSPHRGRIQENEEYQTPEVWIARTPRDGIPALTEQAGPDFEDIPGSAECDIYRILDAVGTTPTARILPATTNSRTVYNLSTGVIGGNRWILITRDKPGRWLALGVYPVAGGPPLGTGSDLIPIGTGTEPGGGPIDYPFVLCTNAQWYSYRYNCTPAYSSSYPSGTNYFLAEYRQSHYLYYDETGCLQHSTGIEQFMGVVACCDFSCLETEFTGTGTGVPDTCCEDREVASTVSYGMVGPLLKGCNLCSLGGNLQNQQVAEGVLIWSLISVVGCSGKVGLELTLTCEGTSWVASGNVIRPDGLPVIPFSVTLTEVTVDDLLLLEGDIAVTGCAPSVIALSIVHPCPPEPEVGFDCVDAECIETVGGAHATLEACLAVCGVPAPNCAACPPAGVGLTLNYRVTSSDCPCVDHTGTMTFDGGDSRWHSGSKNPCTEVSNDLRIECTGAEWNLSVPTTGGCGGSETSNVNAFSGSCTPFRMNFTAFCCWFMTAPLADSTMLVEVWE